MRYGLVYYLRLGIDGLDEFRRRHDPTFDLITPHLGVMFLVPDSVGEPTLVVHLETILRRWQAFPIRIHGLMKSWDHWLFLTLEEGNGEVIQLYDEIYSGPLASYRRSDIEFIPHVALGLFAEQPECYDHDDPKTFKLDEDRYVEALVEAESLGVDVRCVVDKLHLVGFNDSLSRILSTREFRLG